MKLFVKLTQHKEAILPLLKKMVEGHLWKLEKRDEDLGGFLR